jgi:2-polyprenyl-3-methyl-5-hydroxy-6-metoxy-1,4-benzoquinol methylase
MTPRYSRWLLTLTPLVWVFSFHAVTVTVSGLSIGSRRLWLETTAKATATATTTGLLWTGNMNAAVAADTSTSIKEAKTDSAFRTTAVGQEEYTNAITASRDTNISPKEAYEQILSKIPKASKQGARALDLGAGAGLSTQLLYQLGYQTIDAVDWSGDAWNDYVESCPASVHFYEMADDPFFRLAQEQHFPKYDVICYNFAVNPQKVVQVAKTLLKPETGLLLAPVNDRADYWYKQSYWLLDSSGSITYKSTAEVGAWSVQFQPDVTADTCTGIWCGGFNGFNKK